MPTSDTRHAVVTGMPRAGTTFLYHNLQKHPELFLPFRKETNYFSVGYDNGADWYADLYTDRQPNQVGLDISPAYFMDPEAVPRIQAHGGDVRVIVCVRDPVSWVLSFYNQVRSVAFDIPPFEEYIHNFSWPIGGKRVPLRLSDGFLQRSVAAHQEAFGDRLLIYSFEQFSDDRLGTMKHIERFLGVSDFFAAENFEDKVINAGNRRHSRLLNALLSQEKLVAAIGKLVPRQAVQVVRGIFERASKPTESVDPEADARRALAEEAFADDTRFVEALFSDSPCLLGTGESFESQSR
jgi:hypothetical protein